MAHTHGTCVLLELTSVDYLTEYFKTCYRVDVLFELKGVTITVAQLTSSTNDSINQGAKLIQLLSTSDTTIADKDNVTFAEFCSIYIYFICFPQLKGKFLTT